LGAKIRWELESCFNLAGAKDVGNSQGFMLSPLSGNSCFLCLSIETYSAFQSDVAESVISFSGFSHFGNYIGVDTAQVDRTLKCDWIA
jgi:hypothetical protein